MRAFAVAALLICANMACAQECTIGPDQLIGVFDSTGQCRGYSKQFAQKYLQITASQCQPAAKHGHMLLGTCLADAPPPTDDTTSEGKEIRELRAAVVQMQGEIDELHNQMRSQYNELMSEIDYLKSVLESRQRK